MGAAQSTIVIPSRRRGRYVSMPCPEQCCPDYYPEIPQTPRSRRRIPVLMPSPCCIDSSCDSAVNFGNCGPPQNRPATPTPHNNRRPSTPIQQSIQDTHCSFCNTPFRTNTPISQFLGSEGLRVNGQWGDSDINLRIGRDTCEDHCHTCQAYCPICQRGRPSTPGRERGIIRDRAPTPVGRRGSGASTDDDRDCGHNSARPRGILRNGNDASQTTSAAQLPISNSNSVFVSVGGEGRLADRNSRDDSRNREEQNWRQRQPAEPQRMRGGPQQEWPGQDRLVCFGDYLCMCVGCAPDL